MGFLGQSSRFEVTVLIKLVTMFSVLLSEYEAVALVSQSIKSSLEEEERF
jgi:hypothetical protein